MKIQFAFAKQAWFSSSLKQIRYARFAYFYFFPIVLAFAISISSATATANVAIAADLPRQSENTASAKYSSPYPFDADDLLGKIGHLLTISEVSVAKENLEQTFDVQFTKTKRNQDANGFYYERYMADAGTDWYFSLGAVIGPTSTLYVGFEDAGLKHPDICISDRAMETLLKNSGWEVIRRPIALRGITDSGLYQKNSTKQVLVEFVRNETSTCLSHLIVAQLHN